MRFAGFLLMPAGWIIVLAAVMLLPADPPRVVFALAGLGIEALGLTLVVRSYATLRGDEP
jgi:hypothetical protein